MRHLALALALLTACEPEPLVCTDIAVVSLSVTVEDESGAVIDDADVTWRTPDEPEQACQSSDVGAWTCAYEVEGEITVTATAPGYAEASETRTVLADACHVIGQELTLTLTPLP